MQETTQTAGCLQRQARKRNTIIIIVRLEAMETNNKELQLIIANMINE